MVVITRAGSDYETISVFLLLFKYVFKISAVRIYYYSGWPSLINQQTTSNGEVVEKREH